MTGIVRHWNAARGFGKVVAGRGTYFAHCDELVDALALQPGQIVEFTPTDGPRGPRAVDVRPLDRVVSAR